MRVAFVTAVEVSIHFLDEVRDDMLGGFSILKTVSSVSKDRAFDASVSRAPIRSATLVELVVVPYFSKGRRVGEVGFVLGSLTRSILLPEIRDLACI